MSRQLGVLTDWNDERGFGFISPASGGPRVFVHVSAFPRGRRPVQGARMSYLLVRDERNRPRAAAARLTSPASAGGSGRGAGGAFTVSLLFFVALGALAALDRVPATVLVVHAIMSVLAFRTYAADKAAAEQGRWRISESTLHLLALVGGWPGALVARHAFRHKTVKQPFRTIFWATVVANSAVVALAVGTGPPALP